MSEAVRVVALTRVTSEGVTCGNDAAACEEPLEVRVHGEPFAVIMRTPGDDRELAAGFLFAEQVIRSRGDLGAIEHGDRGEDGRCNVVNVTLVADARAAMTIERRRTVTSSSCGLCGRATIESLMVNAPPLVCGWRMHAATVRALPGTLRLSQTAFDRTGGLHAAGLFSPDGALDELAEDVGRHNAVDKVIGRALLADRLPLGNRALFVSGRTSYEIVQKALLAGIPLLAAVSAPSSLAIELATDAGITLIGFVRDDTFNVYAHPQRIDTGP